MRVRSVTQSPLAISGDPDVERFVLVEIKTLRDLLGGLDRHAVLFGGPPEEERKPQPIHAVLFQEVQTIGKGRFNDVSKGVIRVIRL